MITNKIKAENKWRRDYSAVDSRCQKQIWKQIYS